jgi:chemotaxis protein methyltransferase CheR
VEEFENLIKKSDRSQPGWGYKEQPNMKDKLLQDFVGLVSRHTGLYVREQDYEAFRKKISARIRLQGLAEPEGYFQMLKMDNAESRREWKELIGLLTTGESYFFRDKDQLSLIQNRILPELIKHREKDRSLRIWSAGCSTGEEPYSIAIILNELLMDYKNWNLLILGTDVNEESIRKAEEGVYTPWSFRMLDTHLQRRYFKRQKETWKLDKEIQKMVKFSQCNLVKDTFPSWSSEIHNMDIILCRNVLIYFTPETISSVVEKFADTLNDGGYLITGHGELQTQALKRFKTKVSDEQVVYQKVSDLVSWSGGSRAKGERKIPDSLVGVAEATYRIRTKEKNTKKATIDMKKSEVEISATRNVQCGDRRSELSRVHSDIERANYTGAIEKTRSILKETPNNFEANLLMAQAYSNKGEYDKAVQSCRKAIDIEPTSPHPYFLLAQIVEATGRNDEAKDLLKKAIYLKPDFVAPYLELGKLYAKEEDTKRSMKMFSSAIDLLKALPPETSIAPYRDITAGEMLQHVIKLLNLPDKR